MIDRRHALTGLMGAGLMGSALAASLARPALARSGQLGGNANYRLASASGCGDLTDVTVTIDVTQDLVCKPTNEVNGFNFQLNCYSNEARSAWQQYVVGLLGTNLHAKINNFRSLGPGVPMTPIARQQFPLQQLPNLTLPAGYRIGISLIYDDKRNVTGADFQAGKPGGDVAKKRVMLAEVGLGASDIAPIVAFELVLVGPAGGHTAILTSGAGTFSFAAAEPLSAAWSLPSCVAHKNGTAEQSNSVYGSLPENPGASFTQTFGVG